MNICVNYNHNLFTGLADEQRDTHIHTHAHTHTNTHTLIADLEKHVRPDPIRYILSRWFLVRPTCSP
jgi:hypothetical protein